MTKFPKEREAFERLLTSADKPVNLRQRHFCWNEFLPENAIEISKDDYDLLKRLFEEMTCKITFEHKPMGYKLKVEIPTMLQCSHIEVGGKDYVAFPEDFKALCFQLLGEFFSWES